MGITSIEWTDRTWNPVRGCSRVSEGCRNCYAERQAARFAAPGIGVLGEEGKIPSERPAAYHAGPFYGFVTKVNGHAAWTGKVELVDRHLLDPMKWKTPQRVFVNSMSDMFHEALADGAIDRIFAVMSLCHQHAFQILTKRPKRMLEYFKRPAELRARWFEALHDRRVFPGDPRRAVLGNPSRAGIAEGILKGWRPLQLPNVWLGVSVEDQNTADERIPLLTQTPAAVRFVSYEPALGPVDFIYPTSLWPNGPPMCCSGADCGCMGKPVDPPLIHGVDQIIVGGESGPGARPFNVGSAIDTIKQCREYNVSCFVKQLGAKPIFTSGFDTSCWPFDLKWAVGSNGVTQLSLRDKKGGDMREWPANLQVREFPAVSA